MSTHKHIDKICCVALVFTLLLSVVFMCSGALGVEARERTLGYKDRLFDTTKVHTVDIVMNDWEGFIETCTNEEYATCNVVIDGEAYKNVAIRAKGNTSLSNVQSMNSNRYSFKIEFDHYDSMGSYHGLDKLCLNNMIQDNTYMKDYLTYQMMNEFGVAAPLCSYVNITVNGENWGLYLAVEAVEESFLLRNYGTNYGDLYKPDSINMGGGRGNGKDFNMENFENSLGDFNFPSKGENLFPNMGKGTGPEILDGSMQMPDMGNGTSPNMPDRDMQGGSMQNPGNIGGMGGGGANDVSLIYSDDNYSSYSNIFNSAKTDVTDSDKDRLIAAIKVMNEQSDMESCVYIEDVIRYFVGHNFVLNFDSYTGSMIHNYYLYENDGQLSMIPWDYNLGFGGFMSSSDATSLVNYPIDSPVSGDTVDSRPMIAWIFANKEYSEMYHNLFSELITHYFESGKFTQMLHSVKEMISPYVEKDPSKFCTYEEFITGIDTLKEFCLLRAESVQGQLDGMIGSTSEEQSDQQGFVNADGLSIIAMGSMGNTMGGGNDGGNMPTIPDGGIPASPNGRVPSAEDNTGGIVATSFTSLNGASEKSMENNNQGQIPPNMSGGIQQGGIMQMPGNMQGSHMTPTQGGSIESVNTESSISDDALMLTVSVVVLAAGLTFAARFKRRK